MTGIFDEELREQLALARKALAQARADGDLDGVQAYQGRIAGLLRTATKHGIALEHTEEEEGGES
ncbi:hypothetical protein [Kitasatospora sp. GAS204B]|uniref:hypothetical protein n=1 Tax=unclassified Kitasatospora TaxID=2633591 RepID=UPI002473D5DD|nr:hypothetical protein [Kitasatospora sp. GAS204B]MDH6119638.1 hypothetical protein [Kitasatospora sp. GAS204B]